LTTYPGKTYVEDLATDAFGKFAKQTNSKNTKLLQNVFIARYNICLGRIRKNDTLLPNVLVKTNSMQKIQHPAVNFWKDMIKDYVHSYK